MKDVRPAQCTLVPDPPHVLTSNAGWKIEENVVFLQETIAQLHQSGIRTSLFVDPHQMSDKDIALLKVTGTDRVELYTEAYADDFGTPKAETTLAIYKRVAAEVNRLGIDLNAGHDLNLKNLRPFIEAIPTIKEVSIGHALICDALEMGLKASVARYLACLV